MKSKTNGNSSSNHDVPKFGTPDEVVEFIRQQTTAVENPDSKLLENTERVLASLVTVDKRGRTTPQYLAARGAADNIQLAQEGEHSSGRARVHIILRYLTELGIVRRYPPNSTSNGTYRLTEGGKQWLEALINSGLIKLQL